jgi:signal transduction histidine kinase
MPRLHLRFYFALLASLIVFAVIALALWHLDGGGPVVHRIHVLIALPAIALIVSVLAYPLTRRLTKRLERLQQAVESLGGGNLSARVAVEGNDEVAQLAASFNRAASRIEELVGAHKTLLANASHELRTPLARIRLAIELMKNSAEPKRKAGLDQDIAELDLLIDEILLASRLDAVAERNVDEEVDLLGLAAEECARYSDVQLDGSPMVFRGDPRLLRRLLRNLLENAQRHGIPPVKVTLAQIADNAEIVVQDHGPAMSNDEALRLFEPFYRRPNAAKNIGAGLGLALVRQIARRHGGSVRYSATNDGHNSFVVTIPLAYPAV